MILLSLAFLLILIVVGIIARFRSQQKYKRALIQQIQTWAGQQAALDPMLYEWIRRLSEDEVAVLHELLEGYCASLDWELAWLFSPQIDKAPVLKEALEQSVSTYVRTILFSLQMEQDVKAWQTYLAFVRKPSNRKQRPLVQKLYAQLQDEGLAPAVQQVSRKLFRRQPTRKQQIEVIQRAFEREPDRAMMALKHILHVETTIPRMTENAMATRLKPLEAMA